MKKILRVKSFILNKETISSINRVGGGSKPVKEGRYEASYPDCSFTYGPSGCWSCRDCSPSGIE